MRNHIVPYETFNSSSKMIEIDCPDDKSQQLCDQINACLQRLESTLNNFECINKILSDNIQVIQYHGKNVKIQFKINVSACNVECVVIHKKIDPAYEAIQCEVPLDVSINELEKIIKLCVNGNSTEIKQLYQMYGKRSESIENNSELKKSLSVQPVAPGFFQTPGDENPTEHDSIWYFSNISKQNTYD